MSKILIKYSILEYSSQKVKYAWLHIISVIKFQVNDEFYCIKKFKDKDSSYILRDILNYKYSIYWSGDQINF